MESGWPTEHKRTLPLWIVYREKQRERSRAVVENFQANSGVVTSRCLSSAFSERFCRKTRNILFSRRYASYPFPFQRVAHNRYAAMQTIFSQECISCLNYDTYRRMFRALDMYTIDHVAVCCLVNIIIRHISVEAKKSFYLNTYFSSNITIYR